MSHSNMPSAAATLLLLGLVAAPAAAQGRGGIPNGHMPPPGECRVWYDGRPPGRQPPSTSCRDAERIASRDRDARVIYGDDRGRNNGSWNRDDERRRGNEGRDDDRGVAIPRRGPSDNPYPERYPTPYPDSSRYPSSDRYPDRRGGGYQSVPFDNGYKDGYDKGREDARDNDSHDPVRHARYRAGDHGYDRRYGSKEEYKNVYRDGFRAGYDEGYRDANVYGPDRRSGGIRLPWPF